MELSVCVTIVKLLGTAGCLGAGLLSKQDLGTHSYLCLMGASLAPFEAGSSTHQQQSSNG